MKIWVDTDLCKGCGLCIYYCPRDVFVFSNALNQRGYTFVEVLAPEACTGCRLCEVACPDFALWVEKEAPMGEAVSPSQEG
jgi:2-oxoglutarate ferredoxin oxidoreductase subunit delta